MTPAGEPRSVEDRVRSAIYELLDAHADTIAMAFEPSDEQRWAAHLDYLRALQRTSKEILAAWQASSPPMGPQ